MRRIDPVSLREVLESAITQAGMDGRLAERRAVAAWARVVGDGLAQLTAAADVRGGVLTVVARDAALRQELTMMRSALVAALNKEAGSEAVSDIRFVSSLLKPINP